MKKIVIILTLLISTACTTVPKEADEGIAITPEEKREAPIALKEETADNPKQQLVDQRYIYNYLIDSYLEQPIIISQVKYSPGDINATAEYTLKIVNLEEHGIQHLARITAAYNKYTMPFQYYDGKLYYAVEKKGIAYYDPYSGEGSILPGFNQNEVVHVWDFYITDGIIYYIETQYCEEGSVCRIFSYDLSNDSKTELIEPISGARLGLTEILEVKDGKLITRSKRGESGIAHVYVTSHDLQTGEIQIIQDETHHSCYMRGSNCDEERRRANQEYLELFPLPGHGGKFETKYCGNHTIQINDSGNVYIIETAMSFDKSVYLGCI